MPSFCLQELQVQCEAQVLLFVLDYIDSTQLEPAVAAQLFNHVRFSNQHVILPCIAWQYCYLVIMPRSCLSCCMFVVYYVACTPRIFTNSGIILDPPPVHYAFNAMSCCSMHVRLHYP